MLRQFTSGHPLHPPHPLRNNRNHSYVIAPVIGIYSTIMQLIKVFQKHRAKISSKPLLYFYTEV